MTQHDREDSGATPAANLDPPGADGAPGRERLERPLDKAAVARAIATGVGSVPGVARLWSGLGVETATYYRGGKAVGVVVRPDRVAVHVVVDQLPIAPVASSVHEVAQTVVQAAGWSIPVEVVVADVEVDRLPPLPASPPVTR